MSLRHCIISNDRANTGNAIGHLFFACINRRYEMVRLLLDHPDINVNLQDFYGTPLINSLGDEQLEEMLLSRPELKLGGHNTYGNSDF